LKTSDVVEDLAIASIIFRYGHTSRLTGSSELPLFGAVG
jgi:hypothetical protein